MALAPSDLTEADLGEHLGGVNPVSAQDGLRRALSTARSDVGGILLPEILDGTRLLTPEEQDTVDQAILTVAGDVWRRKDAPGGQYLLVDGIPGPGLARDPLVSVYDLLAGAHLTVTRVVVA